MASSGAYNEAGVCWPAGLEEAITAPWEGSLTAAGGGGVGCVVGGCKAWLGVPGSAGLLWT